MTEHSNAPSHAPVAPAPVPKMDLSHEPPAVAKIMSSPEYWSNNRAVRERAVEAAFNARQMSNMPAPPENQTELGRTEGFAPTSNDAVPVDGPVNDVNTAVFPSEMPSVVQRSFQVIAVDVGIGSRELASIAKLAVPYLSDQTDYTYETGERALRQQLGDKADAALRDARAFIKEFPEVLRAMKVRKLANHPGTIRVLAERWRARDGAQSKLKTLRADPNYFGLKGKVDHDEAARLAREAEALNAELFG